MSLVNEHGYFEHDFEYMKLAYDLALKAFELGEIPVGAVIVGPSGNILGLGYNRTEIEKCQNAHAEAIAIHAACQKLDDWRLDGCTLYVTLQPCMICYGLSTLSRVERIVYGAVSPIYGFDIDSKDLPEVYTKHTKFFSSGVMKDEIEGLLKQFFKQMRK